MRIGELTAVEAWIISVYRQSMGTNINKLFTDAASIAERMLNEGASKGSCEVLDFPGNGRGVDVKNNN